MVEGEGTYDASVADEVVEPCGPEDGRELRGERADVVEVGDVELYNVQRALCAFLEVRERGCFVGGTAGGDDEIGRGAEELADELEADAAAGTGGGVVSRRQGRKSGICVPGDEPSGRTSCRRHGVCSTVSEVKGMDGCENVGTTESQFIYLLLYRFACEHL